MKKIHLYKLHLSSSPELLNYETLSKNKVPPASSHMLCRRPTFFACERLEGRRGARSLTITRAQKCVKDAEVDSVNLSVGGWSVTAAHVTKSTSVQLYLLQ